MNFFIEIIEIGIFISILILLILLIKNKLLSRYSATFNYFISIIIFFRMIFLKKITVKIDKYQNYEFLNKIGSKSIFENINPKILKPILFTLMLIWALGFIFFLIKMLHHNYVLYKYIDSRAQDIDDEEVLKLFNDKKAEMKINKNIKLMTLENISSPMIQNFKDTKILLPDEIYTKKELDLILTHELIHFKTKDNYIKLFTNIVTCMYWFNPLVKKFNFYVRDLCELSTDEKVIKNFSKGDIKEYANLLVSIRERYKDRMYEENFTSSFFSKEKKGRLMLRVEELFNKSSKKEYCVVFSVIICLFLLSVLQVSCKEVSSYNYVITQDTKRGYFLKNKNNETYGTYIEGETEQIPDLILVVGDNGKEGYAKKDDLYLKQPKTPEEAIEYEKNKKNRTIPVYKSDGETIIDQIKIVEGK